MTDIKPEWVIQPAALKTEIGDVVLLDVREAEEVAESKIEGSVHIPLGELGGRTTELDQCRECYWL